MLAVQAGCALRRHLTRAIDRYQLLANIGYLVAAKARLARTRRLRTGLPLGRGGDTHCWQLHKITRGTAGALIVDARVATDRKGCALEVGVAAVARHAAL
jgi:hypothetical protein